MSQRVEECDILYEQSSLSQRSLGVNECVIAYQQAPLSPLSLRVEELPPLEDFANFKSHGAHQQNCVLCVAIPTSCFSGLEQRTSLKEGRKPHR